MLFKNELNLFNPVLLFEKYEKNFLSKNRLRLIYRKRLPLKLIW